ncbi:MAG: histidine kinase [Pseudozobellia sp.]|nr:histidine kinase [Pseudozobellia sp.]MBG48525.1 histidine kinase [Pseudozobellia sp.]MBG50578.1 histidine kinase [Pseudozobellia sp.]|tara:strand:+ start:83632 stop:85722 length:2091 start_codon:yes stop_codon:yes gene_type:complete
MYRQEAHFKKFLRPSNIRWALLLVVLLFTFDIQAQKNTKDSIQNEIKRLKSQNNFTVKDSIYINLLNGLGKEQRFYNSDSLLHLSKQALKLSRVINFKFGESKALLGLGDYYSDKGNHKKAISYYQESFKISNKARIQEISLMSKNNLAGEYMYKGDYTNSLTHYLEGIDMAKQYNDKLMLSIMNENVANLYATQNDYEQALDFYKNVKKINNELGDDVISAESMSNMGSLYADMGKLDYAMFNINSSITIFEEHGIMDWLAYAYEIKGKVYLKQKKYKWALYWYNQSEMLHGKIEDERGKIDLYNGMAEAHLNLQNDELSEKYALDALEISKKIKFMEGQQKCAATLYKLNKHKEDFAAALTYHEIYQSLSDSLSRQENKTSLNMLKTKMEHERQKLELIEENQKQLAAQRNYINAALAILLIFIAVTFLMRRSEKIQKNLNKKLQGKTDDLEKRESELREINKTKDRLFSIIGHDLRGPIGAFQSLLKLFKEGEIGQSEFMEFIPKFRHDIDHIAFTLNNLLSWGQTQMNGTITKPSVVALETIVNENIHLLAEIAENKSIKLISHLNQNTTAWSDENQIDIVIRNLISNALKFTPENGMVTISSLERDDHWQISIRDTGVGMDQDTISKLFHKNANVTTYGTNNEKGTGLGLSLCKEMIEKNHGKIWVNSLKRKGSTFHFTVPKSKKNYKKTA